LVGDSFRRAEFSVRISVMAGWFTKIGTFLNSIRGFIWLAFSVAPTVAAFVTGVFAGLNWPDRILVTMATLASGVIFVYYLLLAYDYIVEKHGVRREINAIIDYLRDMADEGHEYIKVETVATMWAGDDAGKLWVWNPKLRKIKRAMTGGEIDYAQRSGGQNPSKRSDANIEDVIAYFVRLRS